MKRAIIAALLALLAIQAPYASADELVQVAPHQAALPTNPTDQLPPLLGFLTRPRGSGPFPSVVVLHGCSGFTAHETTAAETLRSWGYVALALDSLGDMNACGNGGGGISEVIDAYAAMRYLAARDFVAGDRIAVMGFSMGGFAALATVDHWPVEPPPRSHFRAVVAYYPSCQFIKGELTAPALILIGDQDDWSSPDACRNLAAHQADIGISRTAGSSPIDLVVYPKVTHAFDFDFPPHRYLGHFIRYDAAATHDAELKVRAFLRDKLGDHSEIP